MCSMLIFSIVIKKLDFISQIINQTHTITFDNLLLFDEKKTIIGH